MATLRLTAAATGCTAVCWALVRQPPAAVDRLAWTSNWLWACLAFTGLAALALLGRAPVRRTTAALILVGTISCQVAAFQVPPVTSTDAYHYVWHGRVQLAGISPYRYVPGDDALGPLRDPILFPGLGPHQRSGIETVWPLPSDPARVRGMTRNDPRTVLNRPAVPTVYPPVAQTWFAVIAAFTPWSAGTFGIQVGAAIAALATSAGLVLLLSRTGQDLRWALLWGWSPTVALEAAGNGHVDVLAGLFIVGACLAAAAGAGKPPGRLRYRSIAGGMLGLATSVKLFPAILVASLIDLRHLRRRAEFAAPLALLATVAVSYLPHVLAVRSRVLGFLPAYFIEEGYVGRGPEDPSARFGVLAMLGVDENHRLIVGLIVAVIVGVTVLGHPDPDRPWLAGCTLLGWALLIGTPSFSWYTLAFIPLVAAAQRPEWMVVPFASGACYLVVYPHLALGQLAWACAAIVVIGAGLGRWLHEVRGRPGGRRWPGVPSRKRASGPSRDSVRTEPKGGHGDTSLRPDRAGRPALG